MTWDTRTYVAVCTVGALGALVVLIANLVSPPAHGLLPVWFSIGAALFLLGYFIYNMHMKLSGRPPPSTSWERNLTDRQQWTIKVLIAALAVVATVIILAKLH